MRARMRTTWRALVRRVRWEKDLDKELRLHVEFRAEDLRRAGLEPPEAERRARLELGSRENYKEECRRALGLKWFDEAWQDLQYAARILRRSPLFTAAALVSLALGIGANTVVFSVINALVLKPLPVRAPQELYFLQSNNFPSISYPNYRDLRERNVTFRDLIAYRVAPMGLDTGAGAERVWGYLATGNYFDVLGVQPALGRLFHAGDDLRRAPARSQF
jgi:hypothetical protein